MRKFNWKKYVVVLELKAFYCMICVVMKSGLTPAELESHLYHLLLSTLGA
jgi:hypothetical protein